MCGRFAQTTEVTALLKRFSFFGNIEDAAGVIPRYNIAPTQAVPLIFRDEAGLKLETMRWGLIPSWAHERGTGNGLVNARGETLAEKPSFREAYRKRRCLVPAAGFFEWKHGFGRTKTPHYFHRKDGAAFCMAGLWETWIESRNDEVRTFTIVTTDANDVVEPLHHRMPAILDAESDGMWLDPALENTNELQPLLVPYDSDAMTQYPVTPLVNSISHDSRNCVEPAAEQGDLF
jgi:putative SOS response-associated peptidase YedK